MIDHDDEDTVWFVAMFEDNPIISLILFVILIIVIIVATANESDCSKKTCPDGMNPRLMDHDCLCMMRAE